jgi:hypothetical protein
MARTSSIYARVEPEIKEQAEMERKNEKPMSQKMFKAI